MELTLLRIVKKDGDEVVLCKVEADCNLWPFIIFDAKYDEKGFSSNLQRHSFFFPSQNVQKGDYVVVYTSKGVSQNFKNKYGTTTWVYYWGLETPIWNQKGDEVIIAKLAEYKRYLYK